MKKLSAVIASAVLLTNIAVADTPTPIPDMSGSGTGEEQQSTEDSSSFGWGDGLDLSEFNIPDGSGQTLEPSAWVPGEGLNINNITPETLAATYQDILFDVNGKFDSNFSDKISSVFSIEMVTDNIREIGSTDLISQSKLDMGMLNLQFSEMATSIQQDYTAGVQANKATDCMSLFEKTYGDVVDKNFEVMEIPSDFNPKEMMTSAKENIFSTYESAISSGTFQTVRSSINTSGIFSAAAKGAQYYSLMPTSTLSGMLTGFGRSQISGEYDDNVEKADNAIANINIYEESAANLLQNSQYGSSIIAAIESKGLASDDARYAMYRSLNEVTGLFSWTPSQHSALTGHIENDTSYNMAEQYKYKRNVQMLQNEGYSKEEAEARANAQLKKDKEARDEFRDENADLIKDAYGKNADKSIGLFNRDLKITEQDDFNEVMNDYGNKTQKGVEQTPVGEKIKYTKVKAQKPNVSYNGLHNGPLSSLYKLKKPITDSNISELSEENMQRATSPIGGGSDYVEKGNIGDIYTYDNGYVMTIIQEGVIDGGDLDGVAVTKKALVKGTGVNSDVQAIYEYYEISGLGKYVAVENGKEVNEWRIDGEGTYKNGSTMEIKKEVIENLKTGSTDPAYYGSSAKKI